MLTHISVRGAREHNEGVDVDIPRESLTVITGLSGSGNPLAFDTIYAEASAATSSPSRPTRASSSR